MALTNSLTTPDGVTHVNAYLRITRYEVDRRSKLARFDVEVYHDEESANSSKYPVVNGKQSYEFSDESEEGPKYSDYFSEPLSGDARDIFYTYLKTLDKWADWSDV